VNDKESVALWPAPVLPEESLGVLESGGRLVAPTGALGTVLAALTNRDDRWIVVVPGPREMDRLLHELSAWTDQACAFPASEVMPHERLSPRAETVATRLRALGAWRTGQARMLITPALATLQQLVPGSDQVEPIQLKQGTEIDSNELIERLVSLDYRRSELVERRGEFAVRGGLIDIFPPRIDHPVRLELFGDEIERMRTFAVASQRSLQEVSDVEVWPCREMLATPQVQQAARDAIGLFNEDRLELTRLAEGQTFDGMEALMPIVHPDSKTLLETLTDARILLVEPRQVEDRINEAIKEATELQRIAWEQAGEGKRPPASGTYADKDRAIGDRYSSISTTRSTADDEVLDAAPWEHPGDLTKVTAQITDAIKNGTPVVACAPSDLEAERIRAALQAAEISAILKAPGAEPKIGHVEIAVAPLEEACASCRT
jgi:transcription-repair coupling factor (superfamily II helicase)